MSTADIPNTLPDVAEIDFRNAMASFASGVTIVTTRDETGKPWGLSLIHI